MSTFRAHLLEAIALNRARREIYAAATHGRSWRLSTRLIRLEQASLPVAAWLDSQAHPFNAAGIPIVTDDFVSMDGVRPADAPPPLRGVAAPQVARGVRRALRAHGRAIARAARQGRFADCAALARACLGAIDAAERASCAHFAMSRHVVESVGLAAHNAERYRRQSGGATDALARDLVVVQALALYLPVPLDRAAQPFHREGVGLLVNDVPPIPFP